MHNVVSFLYYTAGSCTFNDDLDSILYVPLLIVYSVGSGVVGPKLCNFGNLKLRWRLHQSQNKVCTIDATWVPFLHQCAALSPLLFFSQRHADPQTGCCTWKACPEGDSWYMGLLA